MNEVIIDNEILYIEHLDSFDDNDWEDQGIKDIIIDDAFKNALHPTLQVCKILKEQIKDLSPDQTELAIQLKCGISSGKMTFAIVDAKAEAHISIKFIWGKE